MDWLNDLPEVTGIDRVVAEMAQRLMSRPVIFRSPFWDGDVKIETLGDYHAWARTNVRIDNERGAGLRASEIWEEERGGKPVHEKMLNKTG